MASIVLTGIEGYRLSSPNNGRRWYATSDSVEADMRDQRHQSIQKVNLRYDHQRAVLTVNWNNELAFVNIPYNIRFPVSLTAMHLNLPSDTLLSMACDCVVPSGDFLWPLLVIRINFNPGMAA